MDKQPQQAVAHEQRQLQHFAHLLVMVALRESARDGGEEKQTLVDQVA